MHLGWPSRQSLDAILGEPIDQSGGEMRVLEKRAPVAKAQIGSEEGGLFLVPPLQEGEENLHLNGFHLDIANFVD